MISIRAASSWAVAACLALGPGPAAAISEITVYITGSSLPPGRSVTYRVADRICIGFPTVITVRGGDSAGVPVRICSISQGGAIGIIKPDGSAGPGVNWLHDGARIDAVTGAVTRPPGWTPPVVRPAPPARPRGSPSASVDPSRFAGRWSGRVFEPAGRFKSYVASASLTANADGTITGVIHYSGYNCSGVWTAYPSATAPAGNLTMMESISNTGDGCAPSGLIELAPRGDGRLDYRWRSHREDGEVLSRGTLERR